MELVAVLVPLFVVYGVILWQLIRTARKGNAESDNFADLGVDGVSAAAI
ncbi:MAG: hypothetical protein HN348_12585 [Proteobacteria bacterium]|nr:hypothetical protein [Pseudomonadota bacterium]